MLKSETVPLKIKNTKKKIGLLFILTVIASILYLVLFINPKYLNYAFSVRTPKLIVMILTAFCIGSASVIFQSLINNRVVTPCLLGINALYILVNTLTVFLFARIHVMNFMFQNQIIPFLINLGIMAFAAVLIYGVLFKKTKSNILYILLTGTIMATLFTSISSTLQRMIDPNEFLSLQNDIIPSFNKVNSNILGIAVLAILATIFYVRKELPLLDIMSLGKNQAINLGIDHEKVVQKLMTAVTLFIAIATAMVGPISFFGLVIANLAREFFHTYHHKYLVIGSSLIGVIFLVGGQLLIEHVFSFSTNISVFINIGGGIYFLYLVLKGKSAL